MEVGASQDHGSVSTVVSSTQLYDTATFTAYIAHIFEWCFVDVLPVIASRAWSTGVGILVSAIQSI